MDKAQSDFDYSPIQPRLVTFYLIKKAISLFRRYNISLILYNFAEDNTHFPHYKRDFCVINN